MTSIFTKIINREIPAHVVYEDDRSIAILDKFPVVDGQTLVIPKHEVDYAFELPDELYHHLFAIAKKLVPALDRTFDTERTCLIIEGFEVPHVHVKLYPVPKGTTSLKAAASPGTEASDTVLAEQATRIIDALA